MIFRKIFSKLHRLVCYCRASPFSEISFRNSRLEMLNYYPNDREDTITVGSSLPSVELTEGNPLTRVNINDICKNKKIVLFGVLGAFIPGCTKTHLPGYIERSKDLRKKGCDEIVCITVNDIFVTEAWAREYDIENKLRLLADPNAEFTRAIGMDISIPHLGGVRSQRYSMIVNNNIVKYLAVEPDATGLTCTLAEQLGTRELAL